jgi:hypothetical protein
MAVTQQKVRGRIGVKTWTQAILYVSQEVIRFWFIILQQRGLSNDHILKNRETITNGLYTWLLTRHLRQAILELYQEGSSEATERWDMTFKFADPDKEDVSTEAGTEDVWKTYLDEVADFMRTLNALPPGTIYRVVVDLEDEVEGLPPVAVPGWSPGELKRVDHLEQHAFGEPIIDTKGSGQDLIKVKMEYWGMFS